MFFYHGLSHLCKFVGLHCVTTVESYDILSPREREYKMTLLKTGIFLIIAQGLFLSFGSLVSGFLTAMHDFVVMFI